MQKGVDRDLHDNGHRGGDKLWVKVTPRVGVGAFRHGQCERLIFRERTPHYLGLQGGSAEDEA
jgi:hypothetical protein